MVVLGVAVLAVVSIGLLSEVAAARARAGAAADATALAAAVTAQRGGEACAVAARLAVHNGAALVDCRLDPAGAVTVVAVRVRPSLGAMSGWTVTVTARARAGPAPDP